VIDFVRVVLMIGMVQPDGKLKCDCGNIFDPNEEGGPISCNPYSMPVCGKCIKDVCGYK
jgi:hypothetical protein